MGIAPTITETGAAIAGVHDARLRRTLMTAASNFHVAMRVQTSVQRVLPPMVGATFLTSLAPTTSVQTFSGGLMIASSIQAGTSGMVTRKALRLLNRVESDCVAAEEWGGAHIAATMRATLLGAVPFSRTREMLAVLRAFSYAIENEDQDAVLALIRAGRQLMHDLPKSAVPRVAEAAVAQSRAVDAGGDPLARIRVRFGLLLMIDEELHPNVAEIAVELGVDFHELTDRQVQGLMSIRDFFPDDYEMEIPEEITEAVVARSDLGNRFLSTGLAGLLTHSGADEADRVVRSVAARDRMPTSTLLEAYGSALADIGDARSHRFLGLVRDGSLDAALESLAPGSDRGPDLGR